LGVSKETHLSIEIEQVKTNEQIEYVAALAREIWTQHYVQIVGEKQVEYMLSNFQSSDAIRSQISEGAEYYLAKTRNDPVGYAGLTVDKRKSKLLLSKLYVRSAARGTGAGKAMLDFVEQKCTIEGISCVWLTVNKMNLDSIKWYQHRGFVVTDEVKSDIGGGFFMDDYIMEKNVAGNA
jgi:GNAT superfamily N-acetyltransferase